MRRSVRRLTSVFAVLASLAAAHAAYSDTAIQEDAYVEQKDLISARCRGDFHRGNNHDTCALYPRPQRGREIRDQNSNAQSAPKVPV